MYSDLAPWFHLLTHPSDYTDEAAFVSRVVDDVGDGQARTLLELGSGGGNNASHLKAVSSARSRTSRRRCSRSAATLNPECEHLEGDMRTLRLGRTFDVVFIHDAISYLTTEEDLRQALETAFVHVRPGRCRDPHARRDDGDLQAAHRSRRARRRGRTKPALPRVDARRPSRATSTYVTDFAIIARGPGDELRVVHDSHTLGLFPGATWNALIADVGLELVDTTVENPFELEQAAFVARRPTA